MGEDRGWPSLHAAAQIATSVTEKFTEKTNKVTSNISGIPPPLSVLPTQSSFPHISLDIACWRGGGSCGAMARRDDF